MIFRFVDIDGIVHNHCWNFLSIMINKTLHIKLKIPT